MGLNTSLLLLGFHCTKVIDSLELFIPQSVIWQYFTIIYLSVRCCSVVNKQLEYIHSIRAYV